MIRQLLFGILPALLFLPGCSSSPSGPSYQRISQERAKAMMDEQPDAVVLDVREDYEYESGHIPGAVLLPVGDISRQSAQKAIGQPDRIVLVYCRSGARSRMAAQLLADLGYTQVYEFGGILSWPYEVE